jgi:type II secretory pathway component GspD/PulD (secretin)
VLRAFEQREGAKVLSGPSITTLSGRQAQLMIGDVGPIFSRINPVALEAPGMVLTNGDDFSIFVPKTNSILNGQTLDVVATVNADGYSIQMTMLPTFSEFFGYDIPTNFVTVFTNGVAWMIGEPRPDHRIYQRTSSLVVWDGQTVVLGGPIMNQPTKVKSKVPVMGNLPFISRSFPTEAKHAAKKQFIVFITPTIIDPAGNRVHTDEEITTKRDAVPQQIPVGK